MKQKIETMILMCSLLLLGACSGQEDSPVTRGEGRLVLQDIRLTQQSEVVPLTRAVTVDDDLYVKIWEGDKQLSSYEPGTVPTEIRLPEGQYTLQAYNEAATATDTYDGLGRAVYSVEKPFTITNEGTTQLTVEVPMTNCGVRLSLPDGFTTEFPTCTFTVTMGDRSVELKNGETAYFPVQQEVTAFSYHLQVTNADGESNGQDGTYGDGEGDEALAAGTVYVVTYIWATRSLQVKECE